MDLRNIMSGKMVAFQAKSGLWGRTSSQAAGLVVYHISWVIFWD